MDEKDILESDVRVTLLGDRGKYSFDWVNKDERKVKFIPKDSDFESYSSEARKLLNKKGIFVENSEFEEGNNKDNKSELDETTKERESNDDMSFEPVSGSNKTDSVDEDKDKHKNNSAHKKEAEEHSFIVRMSDTKNRREVIDKVRDKYPDVSDKLELSGPYRVTYRFEEDSIELVSVDDIGMNKSTDD